MYQQQHSLIGPVEIRFEDDSIETLEIIQVMDSPVYGIISLVTATNRTIAWSTVSQATPI